LLFQAHVVTLVFHVSLCSLRIAQQFKLTLRSWASVVGSATLVVTKAEQAIPSVSLSATNLVVDRGVDTMVRSRHQARAAAEGAARLEHVLA